MKRFRIRKMLSVMLAVVTVLSFWFSNVSFTSAEEGEPDPVADEFFVWITDGWTDDIKVEVAIKRAGEISYEAYEEVPYARRTGPDDKTFPFSVAGLADEDEVSIRVSVDNNNGNDLDDRSFWKKGFAPMSEVFEIFWQGEGHRFDDPDANSSDPDFNITVDSPDQFEFSVGVGKLYELMNGDPYNTPVFYFGVGYNNEGSAGIINQVKEYIYAYTNNTDYNNDAQCDVDDIKLALAADLYGKFIEVDSFGSFGIPRPDSEQAIADGIDKLCERITLTLDGTTNATKADGSPVSVTTYRADIQWGYSWPDEDHAGGEPVKSENIPVYVLDNLDEILICTDYEPERGKGNTYFVRDVARDVTRLTGYGANNGDEGVTIVSDFGHVVIGGNGTESTLTFESDNYITIEQTPGRRNHVSDYVSYVSRLNCRVRIMGADATYIAIHGEGESKNYDSMGFNGNATDAIYETGEDIVARVFVGETTLSINPIRVTGLGDDNTKITDVRLKDESVSDGVSIDKSDLTNIKVEFKSNFYDSVTLVVEYNDSITKEIVIERIGLVIHYLYLMDDGEGSRPGEIEYGCYEGHERIDFTYDFYAGEQIIVYATYYHPSNYSTAGGDNDLKLVVTYGDGTKKEISSMPGGHINGGSYGAVDTTTFFITYLPAKELLPDDNWGEMITHQNYMGGMNALVVNDGYDNDTSFGGAQMGNGSGVYWDGDVDWFE
ncbi:MAG: hypothetical protein J6K43_07400 [Lachnospiraceae bacterium]|nr:hypothetical protein [Lachnospiraceae bacterium]